MEVVKKTYQIVFYTLLLCVYAIFFWVQSFFNFEGLSNSRSSLREAHSSSSPAELHTSLGEAHTSLREAKLTQSRPLHSSAGHKIRLNKRFHQENIPPCNVVSIVIPERYIPVQTPDYYKDVFLPSVTRVNHPLRGPPVVC